MTKRIVDLEEVEKFKAQSLLYQLQIEDLKEQNLKLEITNVHLVRSKIKGELAVFERDLRKKLKLKESDILRIDADLGIVEITTHVGNSGKGT